MNPGVAGFLELRISYQVAVEVYPSDWNHGWTGEYLILIPLTLLLSGLWFSLAVGQKYFCAV